MKKINQFVAFVMVLALVLIPLKFQLIQEEQMVQVVIMTITM